MKLIKMMTMGALLAVSTLSFSSEWIVDNANSNLHFISVKKGNIAEIHQFKELSGSLDTEGHFQLEIDLSSVDTLNATRDERMKNFLFEVTKYSKAVLTADIDPAELDAIAEGANQRLTLEATLNLHGMTQTVPLDVMVTRLVGAKFYASSIKPVVLNAADFALVDGVEKLRELAKLPSISYAVPVSFNLTLKLNK